MLIAFTPNKGITFIDSSQIMAFAQEAFKDKAKSGRTAQVEILTHVSVDDCQ